MHNEFIGKIVAEVSGKCALNDEKTIRLLGILSGLIFGGGRGGLAGFMQLLQARGLSAVARTWLGAGEAPALAAAQVEQVFDRQLLDSIGESVGLAHGPVRMAIGVSLPTLFAALGAAGERGGPTAPAALPSPMADASSYLAEWKRGDAAGRASIRARRWGEAFTCIGRWRGLLVLGLGLLSATLLLKQCQHPGVTPPQAAAQSQSAVVEEPPRFTLENRGQRTYISGQLLSIDERAKLVGALKDSFGAENLRGDVMVKRNTAPALWLDRLVLVLPQLKFDGLKLGFNGERIRVDASTLSDQQRIELAQRLRGTFGRFEFLDLWSRAQAALAEFKVAPLSGGGLVAR